MPAVAGLFVLPARTGPRVGKAARLSWRFSDLSNEGSPWGAALAQYAPHHGSYPLISVGRRTTGPGARGRARRLRHLGLVSALSQRAVAHLGAADHGTSHRVVVRVRARM